MGAHTLVATAQTSGLPEAGRAASHSIEACKTSGGQVTTAHRSLATIAIVLGFLSIAGAGIYWIKSARRSEDNEHTMKCLVAYVAFAQVIGGSRGRTDFPIKKNM
jgi:hypothetical protein